MPIKVGTTKCKLTFKKAYVGTDVVFTQKSGYSTITYLQNASTGLTQSRSTYNQVANAGDYVVAMGGYLSSNYSNMAEAYDNTLTRTVATDMVCTRVYACADSFGEYAIIGGGYGNYNGTNAYQQSYDAYSKTLVHSNGNFGYATNGLAVVSNSTYCGFFGGYGSALRKYAKYMDSTFTISSATDLGQARQFVAGTKVGDNILICGGSNASTTYYTNVDIYDKDMVHSTGTSLSQGRYRCSAGHTDNYAFVFGGFISSVSNASKTGSAKVDVYDTDLVHSTATDLSQARGVGGGFSTSTLAGMMTGGNEANGTYSICDYYDNNLTHSSFSVNKNCQEAGAGATGQYLLLFGGCPYNGSTRTYTDIVQVSQFS